MSRGLRLATLRQAMYKLGHVGQLLHGQESRPANSETTTSLAIWTSFFRRYGAKTMGFAINLRSACTQNESRLRFTWVCTTAAHDGRSKGKLACATLHAE